MWERFFILINVLFLQRLPARFHVPVLSSIVANITEVPVLLTEAGQLSPHLCIPRPSSSGPLTHISLTNYLMI